MPRRMASLRASADATCLPSMRISPSSGLVGAGEDLDQRRLAGAVVADQADDSARSAWKSTPFSAWTPPYHFSSPRSGSAHRARLTKRPRARGLRSLSTMSDLHAAGAGAERRVQDDGQDGEGADGEAGTSWHRCGPCTRPLSMTRIRSVPIDERRRRCRCRRSARCRRSPPPRPPAARGPRPIDGSAECRRKVVDHAGEAREQRAEHEAEELHPRVIGSPCVGRLALAAGRRRSSCRSWSRAACTGEDHDQGRRTRASRCGTGRPVGDERARSARTAEGRREAAREHDGRASAT